MNFFFGGGGGGRLRDEFRNIVLQSGINFKYIGSLKYGKM